MNIFDRKFCSYCGRLLVDYIQRNISNETVYRKCSKPTLEDVKNQERHDFFFLEKRATKNKFNPYTGEEL